MTIDRRSLLFGFASVSLGSNESVAQSPGAVPSAVPPPPAPAPRSIILRAAVLPGTPSRLSYDGSPNGPVLRLRKGERLDLTLSNALEGPTSLQWEGARAPVAADGAMVPLAPGATASLGFTPPDSGLFWFHPAGQPGGVDQTAQGLRGVLLVAEDVPPEADLDFLLSLTDLVDGPLDINGTSEPVSVVAPPRGRVRLRVLNASTVRPMLLTIEGARPMLIALDGQPSDLFAPARNTMPLGPGARCEMLFDMPAEAGRAVTCLLRGRPKPPGAPPEPDRLLLTVNAVGPVAPPWPSIAALPPNPKLPTMIPLERAMRADILVAKAPGPGDALWLVNGVATLALPPKPLLRVQVGGAVVLGLKNRSTVPVGFRLHGHVMRLLHPKDDGWQPYWRDSVLVPPGADQQVAFIADIPGRWLIDSPFFAQAASGLRTWFLVEP